MTRILHLGDVHIGRERLEGALPSRDFAVAFDEAVDAAIRERVDIALIAGDFFDRARIEPHHLTEGEAGLLRFREAGIPVVAIEGNHDVVSSYDDRPSWLSYLNSAGLLRLLRTEFREGKPVMKEWTDADRTGNWLDLKGVRLYGAGWFGASTAKRLEILKPHLERKGFTILMLHAGINGMAEEFGMIDAGQLAVVRDSVDYVALGHIHKKYVIDGYAYNGGALENWDVAEARYGDQKGYWLLEVGDGPVRVEHRAVKRRPILLKTFSCDGLGSIEETRTRLLAAAREWAPGPEAAVQVKMTGLPAFSAAEIDLRELGADIVRETGCKGAEVLPAFGRRAGGGEGDGQALPPREVIEREEIEALIRENGRYGEHVELVRELVMAVVSGRTDEEVYADLLRRAAPILDAPADGGQRP